MKISLHLAVLSISALNIFTAKAVTLSKKNTYSNISSFSSTIYQQASTDSRKYHLNKQNRFFIGTPEAPVTAAEYCQFLNRYATAADPLRKSIYNEKFIIIRDDEMDEEYLQQKENKGIDASTASIVCNVSGDDWYTYSAQEGCERSIITTLHSAQVKEQFDNWRQHQQ